MRSPKDFDGVFLYRPVVDMRRGMDGLAQIVAEVVGQDIRGRYLFAFIGRAKDRMKVVYWDRTGYALWYKRLERARFPWPKEGDQQLEISSELFMFLLDGVDVFVRPHADFKQS